MVNKNLSDIFAEHIANNDWKKIEAFFNASEFATHFGIRVSLEDPDQPKCEIATIQSFHLGGVGQAYVNGAIICAVLDLALGLTGLKYTKKGTLATCSLNIELARPIENDRFYVIAKSNRKIDNKIFSEATVFNSNDEPRVYASGMLRVGITNV